MHTFPRALGSLHTPWLLFYIFLARRLGNPRVRCSIVVKEACYEIMPPPGFKSLLRYYFCVTLRLSSLTCKRGMMKSSTSQGDAESEQCNLCFPAWNLPAGLSIC